MADYIAQERLALATGIVEKNAKFSSDDVPGRAWKPVCKDAKAAVRARDAAVKEAAVTAPDPRVAELEAEVERLQAEVEKLTADLEAATAPPADAAQ